MLRVSLATFLTAFVLWFSFDPSFALTIRELLIEPTAQSLRGQPIDLGDRYDAAQLLEHFGETNLAHDWIRGAAGADDAQAVLFEARLLTELGMPLRADSVLATLEGQLDPTESYRYYLQRSRLNLLGGRPDRALDLLAVIDTLSSPVFAPYHDFLLLACLSATGRLDVACDVGEGRLALGIPLSLTPQFEELLVDTYLASQQYDRALRLIEAIKARRNSSTSVAPVLVREVDILFELGDSTAAVAQAVAYLRDRRTRWQAFEIAANTIDRARIEMLSDGDLLALGRVLVRGDDLSDSDAIVSVLAGRSLEGNQAEQFKLLEADLYYAERRYTKAFNLIRKPFADASLERRATLLRARILRKTGQGQRAADEYAVFAKKYPYDAKAAEALVVAADLYARTGNRARSLALLETVSRTYPSSRHARTATMQLANYYLERDEYAQATQILGTAVERSRRQSEELLYYLADARYRQGDEVAASKLLGEIEELDPTSFYLQPQVDPRFKQPLIGSNGHVILEGDDGLLEFLKRAFEIRERSYQNIRATLDVMSEPNANVQASALYLERGRQFLQMGFRDWAELELRVLESDYDLSPRYWFELGVLYDDFAMHWRSVRAFQRVYYSASGETRDSLSFDFQFLMHPVPFPAQVFENCMRNGIPPHLVYAMMRQESRYDQNAVSSAGAVGLMQLMPSTGQHVAGKLGYPDGSDEQLFVPEVNLTFGIWYASHLLARTSGDPLMMLAAYNAGLGNARRWFRDGGNEQSRAIISMVDGIDYGETKDYVKRIVESATIYHALYFDTDPSSGNGFH